MKLPQEFCQRMEKLIGDEYDEFIKSYDTQLNRGVRINPLKATEGVRALLDGWEKVAWCKDGYYAEEDIINGNHPYHATGAVYFQEPSAMAVAEGLPLTENAVVLDLCAAPGGKTTQLAARMKNKGLLISNEIVPKRASVLGENVERMGITNTIVTNESPSRLSEHFPDFFDAILVDAPCSGEGMFRKEPQAVDEWSVAHTMSCGVRQKNILDDAYKMLKCGGYIMYSTCTFSYDENEAVVKYLIDTYNMELCPIPALDMLSDGIGDEMTYCRRVFPHKQKGEGHFIALLKKTQGEMDVYNKKKKSAEKGELSEAVALYREFEKNALTVKNQGRFVLFGDNLYLLPQDIDIDKLKIVRCGLHLGTVRKGRFEPSHALSHAYDADTYVNKVETTPETAEKYMHGETIPAQVKGWCAVVYEGLVLGWGKGSNGVIKNHYPKGLRIL